MYERLILTPEGEVRAQNAARKASIPPWVNDSIEIPDEEDALRLAFSSGVSIEADQTEVTLHQAYSRIRRGFEYADTKPNPEEMIRIWKARGWVTIIEAIPR